MLGLDFKDESSIDRETLIVWYVVTYFFFLWAAYQWNGPIFTFITIFTFGLPVLLLLLSFIGLVMFYSSNRGVRFVCYLFSLLFPGSILGLCILSQPLRQVVDTLPSYVELPIWVTIAIVISSLLFIAVSTFSFWYVSKKEVV